MQCHRVNNKLINSTYLILVLLRAYLTIGVSKMCPMVSSYLMSLLISPSKKVHLKPINKVICYQ